MAGDQRCGSSHSGEDGQVQEGGAKDELCVVEYLCEVARAIPAKLCESSGKAVASGGRSLEHDRMRLKLPRAEGVEDELGAAYVVETIQGHDTASMYRGTAERSLLAGRGAAEPF